MMKPLKFFFREGAPDEDDVITALRLAWAEDCYVRIVYSVYDRRYSELISPDDNMDSVMERLSEKKYL